MKAYNKYNKVSIPKWSDFSGKNPFKACERCKFQSQNGLILVNFSILYTIGYILFQSQNGLILVLPFIYTFISIFKFQSQNGLILVHANHNHFLCFLIVSIPKWSDFSKGRLYHPKSLG